MTQYARHEHQQIKQVKKLIKHPKYQNKHVSDILKDWEQRRNRGTIIHKEIEEVVGEDESANLKVAQWSELDRLSSQLRIVTLKKATTAEDRERQLPVARVVNRHGQVWTLQYLEEVAYNLPADKTAKCTGCWACGRHGLAPSSIAQTI